MADGGEPVGIPACHRDVVEADDRHVVGNAQTAFARRIDHGKRHNVVAAEDRIRSFRRGQERHSCSITVLVVEVSMDLRLDGAACLVQHVAKAARPLRMGGGVGNAANEADLSIAAIEQQSSDVPPALIVVAGHRIGADIPLHAVEKHYLDLVLAAGSCHVGGEVGRSHDNR